MFVLIAGFSCQFGEGNSTDAFKLSEINESIIGFFQKELYF